MRIFSEEILWAFVAERDKILSKMPIDNSY